MRNEQLTDPTHYKPDTAPESPYRKAQDAWDSRIGATVVQAKNWRYAFFMVALLSCVLAGGLIAQSFKHQVVPIVITLDKNKGEPQVIGKVGDIDYQPQRAEIQFFIGRFIQAVRGVPADGVVIRRNWAEAYALLRPGAAATLNAMTNQDPDSPLKKIGQEVVAVQLIGIVPVAGSQSYQARWTEIVYSTQGAVKERYAMTGTFTLETEVPKNEKSLMLNPLGIYITSFQWSRDL